MTTFAAYNTDYSKAVQYIANQTFEGDTAAGPPAVWSAAANGTLVATGATLTVVTAQHHLGAQACQVVSTITVAKEGMSAPLGSSTQRISKGQPYTATVWMKGNAGGETIALTLGTTTDSVNANVTLTTSWVQYTVSWTPAASVAGNTAYLAIVTQTGAVRTWFVDDVVVTGDPDYPPLAANATATVGPQQSGIAQRIVGSCYSDTGGTLTVYQTFDTLTAGNWDVVTGTTNGSSPTTVTGGTPVYIDVDALAPFYKITFTNGATVQTHLRLFTRTFGVARG